MSEEERLQRRLVEIQEAKEERKKLRTLEFYTDEEKCVIFNKFYEYAKEIIDSKELQEDDDTPHWCFEMVMELLGQNVWVVYNKL